MAGEAGLRERKKERTRRLIFESASRLFAERGFDAVTIAEVARAADVSEMTVFNHFPTKEDLFFGGMEFFEERLLEAVRERAPGSSVLDAFRRSLLEGCDRLAERENLEVISRAARLIAASPSLQARERDVVARYTASLARLLAAETGAEAEDVEPAAVAAALMGAHRALVAHVRARVVAGARGPRLSAETREQAARAFGRLEHGLKDFATTR